MDANNDYLDYFNTIFDNDALFEDFASQIEGFLNKNSAEGEPEVTGNDWERPEITSKFRLGISNGRK